MSDDITVESKLVERNTNTLTLARVHSSRRTVYQTLVPIRFNSGNTGEGDLPPPLTCCPLIIYEYLICHVYKHEILLSCSFSIVEFIFMFVCFRNV